MKPMTFNNTRNSNKVQKKIKNFMVCISKIKIKKDKKRIIHNKCLHLGIGVIVNYILVGKIHCLCFEVMLYKNCDRQKSKS